MLDGGGGLQLVVLQLFTKEYEFDTIWLIVLVDIVVGDTFRDLDVPARSIGLVSATTQHGETRMMVARAWLPLDWNNLVACA